VPGVPTVPSFPILVGGRLRRAGTGLGRPLHDAGGALVGHAVVASPAEVARGVAAARAALPAWSGTSVQERGRILFDVAERLDGPHAGEVGDSAAAADRWLWYAGWTDKIAGLHGGVHPVAGPYASWSAPGPVGVVGAHCAGSPLELADALGAALAVGATAVVVAPPERAADVAQLAEVLATAELPPGAANLLTADGAAEDLVRAGVDGLDLATAPDGAIDDTAAGASAVTERTPPGSRPVEREAAAGGVRVLRRRTGDLGLARLRTWSTTTTVWLSAGR
jgi:acyl-CoA reductase-like NAD-dependent aldehyde dehydrogenase